MAHYYSSFNYSVYSSSSFYSQLMEAMVRGESGVIALKLAENKQAPEDETGCVTIPHRRMGAKIVQN